MDCKSCKEAREVISRHAHEADLDRMDRVNKRWFWAWMITFILFIMSWAGFLWYESQWEVVESTITQEAVADNGSDIRLVGGDYYGSEGQANSQNEKP